MADQDTGGGQGADGSVAGGEGAPAFSNEDISATLSWLGEDADAGDPGTEGAVQEGDAEGEPSGQEPGDTQAQGDDTGEPEVDASSEVEESRTLLDPATGEPQSEPEGEEEGTAKRPSDWATVRQNTIARALKALEPSLSKRVTAADMPKELDKRRSAMERTLGRYASLEDALIAGWNAQERIRSGQYKQPLPANASEQEKAEWRQANAIPKDAKEYDARVPDHQWTEADEPILESFKEAAHSANFTQDQLSAATRWFKDYQAFAAERIAENQAQIDRADTKAARDLLRDQLEGDFGPSITLMGRFLADTDVFPEGIGAQIAEARMPDGRRLINNPDIARFLIESARSHYGEGAMITGQAAEAVASEEAELEALMNSDIATFQQGKWKNTGISGSERMLQIMRQKESRGRRAG